MSKYRKTIREALEEIYVNEAQSHTVRYTDPLNKKKFAVPFKTHDAAEKKMAQLKKDGVKDIKITMDTLKPNVSFKEENDHEVSMARGELEAIADKATQLASMLQGKSDEGNPLEAWVQSKITKAKDYINSVSDYLMYNPDMKQNEETILEYTQQQIKQAYGILNDPRQKGGNYDGAVKAIEKFAKGLSNHPDVANALKRANEELKEEIKPEQLKKLKDSWKDIKLMSPEKVKTLKNFLDRHSTDSLMQLAQANINFVSNMARSLMYKRKSGDPKHAGSMREGAAEDMQQVAKLRIRQMMLQMKMQKMDKADPKNKTPLAIAKNDLENIQMRMDQLKDRAQRTQSEEVELQELKQLQEKIEGLANKSEKSGVPYGILKKVYDRGMAAWKGGHRPGTTPQQWAFARVNSFLTGGKTRTTADADLWQKAKAAKSKKQEKQ